MATPMNTRVGGEILAYFTLQSGDTRINVVRYRPYPEAPGYREYRMGKLPGAPSSVHWDWEFPGPYPFDN